MVELLGAGAGPVGYPPVGTAGTDSTGVDWAGEVSLALLGTGAGPVG